MRRAVERDDANRALYEPVLIPDNVGIIDVCKRSEGYDRVLKAQTRTLVDSALVLLSMKESTVSRISNSQ